MNQLERAIVRAILEHMAKHDFYPVCYNTEENEVQPIEQHSHMSIVIDHALDAVFEGGMIAIGFNEVHTGAGSADGSPMSITFIPGNGRDIVHDWSEPRGPFFNRWRREVNAIVMCEWDDCLATIEAKPVYKDVQS